MRKSKKTLKRDECLMLKKVKKTHQSPSSKTKADEERKNWSRFYFFYYYYFFFGTVSTEDWSFGVGR